MPLLAQSVADAGSTSTTSSYGFITGSTHYAGGSTTSVTSSSTVGVAQGTVILGGSVLQVGGNTLNQSLPMIQVNKTVVDITDESLRDILHFGVPPVQVSPSGPNSITAVLTTKIINGRCGCYMEDTNGKLSTGLEKASFFVFLVHAINESVVQHAEVALGKVTEISNLAASTNYMVKYYIKISSVWLEVTSDTMVTTGAGTGEGGVSPTPTPAPGTPAKPDVFSTPQDGAPTGVSQPTVTRNPYNPNMVDVTIVIPIIKATPSTTQAPTAATLAPGVTAAPTTVPSATASTTGTPSTGPEPVVYTVLRNGDPIFNGTSTGGSLSFTSPFPNENDLVGDIFQLKLCNSKGCISSTVAVTPPKETAPGRTGTGISPDEPLPTGKRFISTKTTLRK